MNRKLLFTIFYISIQCLPVFQVCWFITTNSMETNKTLDSLGLQTVEQEGYFFLLSISNCVIIMKLLWLSMASHHRHKTIVHTVHKGTPSVKDRQSMFLPNNYHNNQKIAVSQNLFIKPHEIYDFAVGSFVYFKL